MKSRVLFAMVLFACAGPSRTSQPAFWSEAQTAHFTVRTDLDDADVTAGATALEEVRAAILASGFYPQEDLPRERATVVALASHRELQEFADKSIGGFVTSDAFGLPLMVVGGDLSEEPLVKHELAHIANDRLLVSKPRWVNEGLACYFQTLKIDRGRGQVTYGAPDRNRLNSLDYYSLDYFRGVLNRGYEAETLSGLEGYAFETHAWLLVHWMIDTRPRQFRDYLARLSRGDNTWVAFEAAFPNLHEADIEQGIREWRRHGMATRTVPLPAVDAQVARRRLAPAEVFALRADLLRVSPAVPDEKRKSVVGAEVARALSTDPGEPLALAVSSQRDGKAAVAAHPDDWRSWVLVYDADWKDRAAIEKAAAMAPNNATVLKRLAFSDQNTGKPRDALTHALHAVEVAPGRADVLDALAQVLAANRFCREALEVEQRALDAIPDGANSGIPRAYRAAMTRIQNTCR